MVARRKFVLGQAKRTAQSLDPGNTPRRRQLLRRHGARIGIGRRRRRNFVLGHGTHGRLGKRSLAAAVDDLDDGAVRPNSRGSHGLAHVAPPVGLNSPCGSKSRSSPGMTKTAALGSTKTPRSTKSSTHSAKPGGKKTSKRRPPLQACSRNALAQCDVARTVGGRSPISLHVGIIDVDIVGHGAGRRASLTAPGLRPITTR